MADAPIADYFTDSGADLVVVDYSINDCSSRSIGHVPSDETRAVCCPSGRLWFIISADATAYLAALRCCYHPSGGYEMKPLCRWHMLLVRDYRSVLRPTLSLPSHRSRCVAPPTCPSPGCVGMHRAALIPGQCEIMASISITISASFFNALSLLLIPKQKDSADDAW